MWCEGWGFPSQHNSYSTHSPLVLCEASGVQWRLEHFVNHSPFWLARSPQTFLQERQIVRNCSEVTIILKLYYIYAVVLHRNKICHSELKSVQIFHFQAGITLPSLYRDWYETVLVFECLCFIVQINFIKKQKQKQSMIANICHALNPTFLFLLSPSGWLRGCRQAHVILGIDAEVIFPPLHDIADCELVIEEPVSYYAPGALGGVQLGYYVVEAVVTLLIWRWLPDHCHCARYVLLQLHWARRLWVVCNPLYSGKIKR